MRRGLWGGPEGQTPKDPNIPNGLWRRNLLRGQPVLQQMGCGTHGRVSVLPEHQIIMYLFSVCFCTSQNKVPVLDHMRGHHRNHPGLLYPTHRVSLAFPTVSYLCLHEGLEALDLVMSHFLAISLRTRELPHLSAGTETSSGGRMGCALLPVLPVSQGPGEVNWGLSLVAVLFRWVK